MFISKPLLNTRLFTAATASLPANNTVEVEVNSTVSCSPVNSVTIRGGTRYRANNYAYPYRYQFIGTNTLGLSINQLTGLISGTVPRINSKTATTDALKVEVIDSYSFRANFSDKTDNFKKNRYCEVIFKVTWPPIVVNIPTNKKTFAYNMDDDANFNPFIDTNNNYVVSGGAMAGGVYTDAEFKYEFDVNKLKELYSTASYVNDISATTFGDLSINNNTGLITGKLNDKFLSLFSDHTPGTKNLSLYFIVKDKFDNRYGVDKAGNINTRVNIAFALTLTELTTQATTPTVNLFLLKSLSNTSNPLPIKILNNISAGVKPYDYTFNPIIFSNNNFSLVEQSDHTVNLIRSASSTDQILAANNGTTATIKITDKSGQQKTVTAFIEVRDDLALDVNGGRKDIDIAVGDGLISIYDDTTKPYYNKFVKNPFSGTTGGYPVYAYSTFGAAYYNHTTIDSATGEVNNQQFTDIGSFTTTFLLTDAKGYIKLAVHYYKVWPKLVAVIDSTLPIVNNIKTKVYFAETNLTDFSPITLTTAGSGTYKYEITASSGTYASSYSIDEATGKMSTSTAVTSETSVASFTLKITDTITHVVIPNLQIQINTKPARITIAPAQITYPLNEVNGFYPFKDIPTVGQPTYKMAGVTNYKYTFVTSATDTDSGVATKDYYTIDSTGLITYTGNGLPFDSTKTVIYVKIADADVPTIVRPAIATITLFGLTIAFPGVAPQIGSSLSTNGVPPSATDITYQWFTVDNGVATILPGATNTTFLPTAAESHKSIAVVVKYALSGFKYAISSLNAVTVLAADETPIVCPYPVFAYKWQRPDVPDFSSTDMDGYFAVYGKSASIPNPTIINAQRIGGGGYGSPGGARSAASDWPRRSSRATTSAATTRRAPRPPSSAMSAPTPTATRTGSPAISPGSRSRTSGTSGITASSSSRRC